VSAPSDPWAVLGLPPGASVDEAHAARRRLAKHLHPDLSGDGAAMVLVNRAVAEVEAGAGAPPERLDEDSFSVPMLPAEAFEALFVVGYGLGEVLVADEPYRLELYLAEPLACFCALSLVPEAGGSIVTIELTGADDGEPPPLGAVRAALIAELETVAAGAEGR
jgi:hypothetical protein